MRLPAMNPVCSGPMISDTTCWSRLERMRLKILRSQFSSVIGLQLASLSRSLVFFGINTHLECFHVSGGSSLCDRMLLNITVSLRSEERRVGKEFRCETLIY